MSDLVVTVRQISNYPALGASNGTETLLVQQGGLGGPYASLDTAALVSTALQSGTLPLGVGLTPLANAAGGQVFAYDLVLPSTGAILSNFYVDTQDVQRYLTSGPAGAWEWDPALGFAMSLAPAGSAGQPLAPLIDLLNIDLAGNMRLNFGTLTVARDPAAANEVATMGWVGNNTVASFNARRGQVTLNAQDVYGALQLCDPIATQPWVQQSINASIGTLLTTHPFVFSWNGRCGAVYLTLSDITCVFFQPGQQPISPTPPVTSNDNSIATTAWVIDYITTELEGSGQILATQPWVLANTVNSFNGRRGVVSLTGADVFDVGAASLNSPNFSGVPTAPTANPGQATGQIATTAFVQQAITANTAGVSTFNTRTGDVVLETADLTAAGGITNPSPNLTGAPTAPTATPGTSSPQIANTQFVMTALGNAVTSFNTRTGAVVLTLADITGAGGAPLVSPNFSSVPTAPTAAPGTSTVQLATTAFVTQALAAAGGVSSFNSRTGAVDLLANDISAAGGLVNPSVNLTGVPTAPTAPAATNSQQLATTAFVVTAISTNAVSSFNTRTGAVTLVGADISAAGGALLAGPAFTGAPTAPTATLGTNNTQLATTAFVQAAISSGTSGVTSFNGRTGAVTLSIGDITAAGGAPSASPQFTGTPQGPTATAGTATTQLATTQFVQTAIAGAGVASFNGRTGAVTLIANDLSAAGGALLASPTFTGVPAAPTAAPGDNTTALATTAFVAAALGGATQQGPFLPLAGGVVTGSTGIGTGLYSNSQAGTLFLNTGSGVNWAVGACINSAATGWVRTPVSVSTLPALFGANASSAIIYVGPSGAAGSAISWVTALSISATGVVAAPVQLTAPIINISGGAFAGYPSTYWNGGYAIYAYNSSYYWQWNASSGDLLFAAASRTVTFIRASDGGLIWPVAATYKPGGGAWIDSSDIRLKRDIESYTAGLAEIRRLRPVSYCFNGLGGTPDDGLRYHGLIADEVVDVMPEMVGSQRGKLRQSRSGPLDASGALTRIGEEDAEETDILTLNTTPLIYALLNAVTELASRVERLEARA